MKEKTNKKMWQKLLVVGIIMVMFLSSMPVIISEAEAETKNTDTKSVDGTITLFSDDMEGLNYWESTGCWERGIVSLGGGTKVIDVIPPTIVLHIPLNDAVNVGIWRNVEVTFSEPMNTGTVTYTCAPNPGGWSVAWSGGNTIATYSHSTAFNEGATYTFQITAGQDLAGKSLVAGAVPNPWSFTTVADTTPPTVTATIPLSGATNVLVGANIEVTFSEPMNTASVQSAFSSSPNLGTGSFTWFSVGGFGDRLVVFNPDQDMAYGTTYTITIGTGAKDKAGNNMVSAYSWSFTTKAEPYNPGNCFGTNLAGDYPNNANDTLTSPTIDLIGATSATLTFYHLYRMELNTAETQAYDGGVVEITTDNITWYQIQPVGGYPFSVDSSANNPAFDTGTGVYSGIVEWGLQTFDLSSYANNRIRIRFRFGSNSAGTRLGWYIDNINITATFPLNDIGVMQIGVFNPARRENPYKNIVPLGCPIKIYGMIRNYGINNQNLFDVSCTITDPDSAYTVLTKQISLGQGNITDVVWQYIPRKNGNYTIKVSTGLAGDERTSNNIQTLNIQTDNFIFLDDGEYSPEISGLIYTNQSNINSSAWQITNTTSHDGTQAWWCGNNTTGNYMNNMNEPLITPQIYLSNLSDCKLSFWTKYHLEGSRWVIIGYPIFGLPGYPVLLTNSADVNTPGSYILNISATEVYTHDNITFGVASSGTIDNVTWYFGDGEQDYGVLVNHSYMDDGNYTAYCVIDGDEDGDDGYAKFPIEITVLNRPPVPVIDAYRLVNVTLRVAGKKGNTVTLTLLEDNVSVGQASVTREPGDPDEQGKTITLKVRGNKTYQALLEYDGSNGGANPVKLIFTMDENEDEEVEITFNSANGGYQEQTINIDSTLEKLLENNTMIIFNASEAYDIDGYITNYSWDFGDGTNGTDMVVNHIYAVHDVYNVTLNITDDDCATNESMIPVELSIPTLLIDQHNGVSILPPPGVDRDYARLRDGWDLIRWRIPPRLILRHYDNIWVEISTDNVNWNTLSYYPGAGAKNSSNIIDNVDGWVKKEITLSSYTGQNVWVRFRMVSDSSVSYEGAYIDDILINGTYIGEIPEPSSFNFYAEAYRGSTNITDIYIRLHPLLLEPMPSIVNEVKIKLLDKNNNTIETKTYTNVDVEDGDSLHFHDYMNCTYVNVSVKINGEIHERKVNVDEIPDITPAKSVTTSETTDSTKSTSQNASTSEKGLTGTTFVLFSDNMECGSDQWDISGAVWIGSDFDQQTPYVYCLWHQTVGKYNSFNHSWAYNIEAVKNYDLKDYLNTTYGQQYFNDTSIWLGPLVRRHQGLLSTKQEIDLRLFKSANLTFWTWWDTEYGTRYDKKLVQVSSDHGSFETVYQISEKNCVNKSWQKITVNLSSYCGHRIKIGFRFDTTDTKYDRYEGWYVDDVVVTGTLGKVYGLYESYTPPYAYGALDNKRKGGYSGGEIDNKTGNGKVWAESGSYAAESYADVFVQSHNSDYSLAEFSGTNNTGFAFANVSLNSGEINKWPDWWAVGSVSVGIGRYEYAYSKEKNKWESLGAHWEWVSIVGSGKIKDILAYPFIVWDWNNSHAYMSDVRVHAYAKASGDYPMYVVPGDFFIEFRSNPMYSSVHVDSLTINYMAWFGEV